MTHSFHVLLACVSVGSQDWIKASVFITKIRHMLHAAPDDIHLVTVNATQIQSAPSTTVPSTPGPFPVHEAHRTTLMDFLHRHPRRRFDLIAFIGCNHIGWLFPSPDDVNTLRSHLTPQGKILIYEKGLNTTEELKHSPVRTYGFTSWEHFDTGRPLGSLYGAREQALLERFNALFHYIGDGVYCQTPAVARCRAPTRSGRPCRRPGRPRCWQHS